MEKSGWKDIVTRHVAQMACIGNDLVVETPFAYHQTPMVRGSCRVGGLRTMLLTVGSLQYRFAAVYAHTKPECAGWQWHLCPTLPPPSVSAVVISCDSTTLLVDQPRLFLDQIMYQLDRVALHNMSSQNDGRRVVWESQVTCSLFPTNSVVHPITLLSNQENTASSSLSHHSFSIEPLFRAGISTIRIVPLTRFCMIRRRIRRFQLRFKRRILRSCLSRLSFHNPSLLPPIFSGSPISFLVGPLLEIVVDYLRGTNVTFLLF